MQDRSIASGADFRAPALRVSGSVSTAGISEAKWSVRMHWGRDTGVRLLREPPRGWARWHGADRSTCEQAFVGRPKLRDRGARWSVEGHWRIHLALGREPEGAEASLMSAPVPTDLSGVSWTWGDRMMRPRRDRQRHAWLRRPRRLPDAAVPRADAVLRRDHRPLRQPHGARALHARRRDVRAADQPPAEPPARRFAGFTRACGRPSRPRAASSSR